MPVAQSLTISREGGDLVIENVVPGGSTDFSIPEGGLSFPDFEAANTYAPDSADTSGSVLNAYRLGLGTMALTLEVHGTSIADLQANRRALEAAFFQPAYTVTLTIGGATEVYPAFPAWPKWGAINSGALVSRIATATLIVPVNPMEA